MKYIPAEKLIAEIERRIEETKSMKPAFDQFWAGQISAFKGAIKIITSLQQEQPEGLHFIPLNRLIQKIPSKNWNNTVNNYARKLRDCLIEEGYLKDAEVLQDYISYMNGYNVPIATMDEQEQPEVDLDSLLTGFMARYAHENSGEYPSAIDIARRFYELGRLSNK